MIGHHRPVPKSAPGRIFAVPANRHDRKLPPMELFPAVYSPGNRCRCPVSTPQEELPAQYASSHPDTAATTSSRHIWQIVYYDSVVCSYKIVSSPLLFHRIFCVNGRFRVNLRKMGMELLIRWLLWMALRRPIGVLQTKTSDSGFDLSVAISLLIVILPVNKL